MTEKLFKLRSVGAGEEIHLLSGFYLHQAHREDSPHRRGKNSSPRTPPS